MKTVRLTLPILLILSLPDLANANPPDFADGLTGGPDFRET